jgi:hypothetical protein
MQGLLYLLTGIWPILHMTSFMAVTGPKTDLWLVKTMGAVLAATGIVMLRSLKLRRIPKSVALLGFTISAVLFFADVHYTSTGTISNIYLFDAFLEMIFAAGWAYYFSLAERTDFAHIEENLPAMSNR